jgi:topoisomerase-4 subunit A
MVLGAGRGGKPQELRLTTADVKAHIAKRARKGKALESRIKPSALAPLK